MIVKSTVKKAMSLLTALAIFMPAICGITAIADDEEGIVPDQTQPITVVGKRVTGDDVYFEISLEVNDDEDLYSSVGVVLQYDPDYIIPASSWDKEALPADMSENTTWATRRALPTLGLETWSSHTALAYETTDENDKKVGYLYLGAEHPLPGDTKTEEPADPGDGEATPADETPADPTEPEEPEPTPQPGAHPIVAARFMYKTTPADEDAGIVEVKSKDMKEKLITDWRNGTNSAGVTPAKNWDYDWSANKILTIASDEIAAKSPAQYPFAIYTHAYEEKAYMHTFPAPFTPASPDPSPTPKPASAYKPVVGSGIAEANKLKAEDITVVTLEGDSAKSGGLKLSDIMVIMFYDWDNSLIGTITAGIGAEMEESVNAYCLEKLVHPDLRNQTEDEIASLDRKDTYRGVYPYTGPSATNPRIPDPTDPAAVTDGEEYPLTNKLDYVFAGKTYHPEAPYSGGWLKVTTKTMPETFTGLTLAYDVPHNVFGRIDENGDPLDADGNPDPDLEMPLYLSYDFNNITADDLDGGVLMVKAVYTPGTWLDSVGAVYTIDPEIEYNALTETSLSNVIYGISMRYRRIDDYGYGVKRAKDPKIRMQFQQKQAKGPTTMQVDVENSEVIDVLLTPSNEIESISNYQLVDLRDVKRIELNIVSGTNVSLPSTRTLTAGGTDGFETQTLFRAFQEAVYNYGSGATTAFTYLYSDFADFGLKYQFTSGTAKDFSTSANVTLAKGYLKKFIAAGVKAGQTDPYSYTYYQLQYAIITKGTGASGYNGQVYVTPEEAETFCKATYPWCT